MLNQWNVGLLSPSLYPIILLNHTADIDPPIPYSQFRGCFVTKAPSDLWANFVLITIVDISKRSWLSYPILDGSESIVVLVPMVVSAWRSC
jgi:hypothetical protein